MYDEFDTMLGNPPVGDVRAATGWFRIGHMGTTADSRYVLPTLVHLEMALSRAGHNVSLGDGVTAAERVFGQRTAS